MASDGNRHQARSGGGEPRRVEVVIALGDDGLTRRVKRAELPILCVKCVRSPEFGGDSYARIVGEFKRIARREKIQFLQEGAPYFETKLAGYKSHILGSRPAR